MFILDLPDLRATCEKVCFVNPSGLVELWVTKSRLIRYEDPNRLLRYLRRELGDNTIHKITPYEKDSYSIIRHPLRDVNKFIKVFDDYVEIGDCSRWCKGDGCCKIKFIHKHIELFDNLDFIIQFCSVYWDTYHLMPIHFKCNKKLLVTVLIKDQRLIRYAPDSVKYNRDLIIYLIKSSGHDNKPNRIYRYLPYILRGDPEILSISLNNGCWTDIMHNIVDHIPNYLINNCEFMLGTNIDIVSVLYPYVENPQIRNNKKFICSYIVGIRKYSKDDIDISHIYNSLSMELKLDLDILTAFLSKLDNYKYIHIPSDILSNKSAILGFKSKCIRVNIYVYISDKLKRDPDIVSDMILANYDFNYEELYDAFKFGDMGYCEGATRYIIDNIPSDLLDDIMFLIQLDSDALRCLYYNLSETVCKKLPEDGDFAGYTLLNR